MANLKNDGWEEVPSNDGWEEVSPSDGWELVDSGNRLPLGLKSGDVPAMVSSALLGLIPGSREMITYPRESLGIPSKSPILNMVPPGPTRAMAAAGLQTGSDLLNSILGAVKAPVRVPEQILASQSNIIPRPVTPQGALASAGLELGTSLLTGPKIFKAAEAIESAPKLLKFGGNKALYAIAEDANKSVKNVASNFSKEYDILFSKIGSKKVDASKLTSIQEAKKIAPQSQLIDEIIGNNLSKSSLDDVMSGQSNMGSFTAKQLHSLRQDITSNVSPVVLRGAGKATAEEKALKQIYDQAGELLGSKDLGGSAYSDLTSRFSDFMKKEFRYIKKFTTDQFGNVTETKLKGLGKQPINVQEAFNRLGQRTGQQLVPDINAINRARAVTDLIKRYGVPGLIGGATGGGGYLIARRLLGD